MIEYLKHIGTAGKILWGTFAFIVGSIASVFIYIEALNASLREDIMSLRDQDMSMIRSNLSEIKEDAHYTRKSVDELKRYLMEQRR